MPQPYWLSSIVAIVALTSCSSSPAGPSPGGQAGYAGDWRGATLQGRPMSFTVSTDEKVTSITVEYSLNGCSGSRTFANLSLDIASVNRPPNSPNAGPFENPGFGFASGALDQPNFFNVSGAFTSSDTATGVMIFGEYAGCGNGAFVWNAARR